MMQVLSALVVSRFYKLNAGFFLFLFIILFGILPGADTIHLHRGLMLAAVSTPLGLLLATVVFVVYNLKCISFCIRELDLPENSFVYNMQGLSNRQQFAALTSVHGAIYLPMLTYGAIMAATGVGVGHYAGSAAVLIILCLMLAIGTYAAFNKINGTWKQPMLALPDIRVFRNKGFFSYLLHYSINSKKGAFISIKIFSLLALQFLVALNADKAGKENTCFLILFCISAHSLLPGYYVQFVETELAFLRNMPMTLAKRGGQFVFTYAVILLPELLFLLYNEINIIPLATILSLYLLAITRLSLYTAIQYLPDMNLNKYTGVVFVMFFVTLILLASFSLWLFILAEIVATVVLFGLFYYRYQAVAE